MSPGLSVAPPVLHAGADSLAGPRWGCRGGRGTGGKSGGGRGLGGGGVEGGGRKGMLLLCIVFYSYVYATLWKVCVGNISLLNKTPVSFQSFLPICIFSLI